MNTSIIIATYERPRALELVLQGLLRQSAPLGEVIFADDGSNDRTRSLIATFAKSSDYPVAHMWHRREGIQKAGIVNSAIAVAQGENLLLLDGDCIPDHRWLSDHISHADGRTVWQGRRLQLAPSLTATITPEEVAAGDLEGWCSLERFTQLLRRERENFHLAIRIPQRLVRLFDKRKGLMGCNFSAPKAVIESINGYDASWAGAKHLCEDLDLEIRLRKHATPLKPLLHAANVFHLNHDRAVTDEAVRLREERWHVDSSVAVDGVQEAAERIRSGTTRNLLQT
jgi:glycosyltransferase involved in cell wall biosynthesis